MHCFIIIILRFLQLTRCIVITIAVSANMFLPRGLCQVKPQNIFKTNARERGAGHPRSPPYEEGLAAQRRDPRWFRLSDDQRKKLAREAKDGCAYASSRLRAKRQKLRSSQKTHARTPECVPPLCYFRAASRAASPEALNRTGSSKEEGSSHDTVPTCWSTGPFLT